VVTDEVIVRNSAKCLACGDEIESKHRHDYVTCSCGAISVDGGTAYLKRGWVDDGRFKGMDDTSILAPEESRSHTLENSDIQVGGVHHSARCKGRPCPIHNRSDHALRSWPQVWHKGRVMRICEHGAWHKDPDEPGKKRCIFCDGCCLTALHTNEEEG
jgi:hypothetical protein